MTALASPAVSYPGSDRPAGRSRRSGDRRSQARPFRPGCLCARRGRDRARPVRLGHALAALSQLQRALALLAVYADLDLCDLRVRRAHKPAARRWPLGRCRTPARPPRRARNADGVDRPLHARRLGRLAVRRPRAPGARDRRGAQRRQRLAARLPSASRPGGCRTHERDRGGRRTRPGHPRLLRARPARNGSAGSAVRPAARSVRDRLRRRLLDARAGRRAEALPAEARAPEHPGGRPPPVRARRARRALVLVDRSALLLARARARRPAVRDVECGRGRHRDRRACGVGGGAPSS